MKLPKKLHLTCPDKNNIKNGIWRHCLKKYREKYRSYEIILYGNSEIYSIIKKHFPQYLEKIKKIKIGAILADVFRYLILYLEGGIYSDLDCEPMKNIDELFRSDYKYFHGDEKRHNEFYIYKSPKKIINNKWDFYHNVCSNCTTIKSETNPVVKKCHGHKINISTTSTILCYEFHKDWNSDANNNLSSRIKNWCYKDVGICQWFIISEPKQEIFLKMFMYCMDHNDELINMKKDRNYHYNVLNSSGPLRFTKIVLANMSDKIKILPSDFFCRGSGRAVPATKNSFIRHHFTGSWL